MEEEGLVPGKRFGSRAVLHVALVIGRLFGIEVGRILPRPLLLFLIPPDEFLALAPRLAVGTCRRPVVEDANIVGPGESPTVTEQGFRFALVGFVLARVGEYSGVNPATAGGRTVVAKLLVVLQKFSVSDGVT